MTRDDPIRLFANPPHDERTEMVMLGCLIAAPVDARDLTDELIESVTVEDFHSPKHVAIFDAIRRVHRPDQVFDLAALAHTLDAGGQLETIGGVEYLTELVEGVSTPDVGRLHAKTLRAVTIKRRLVSAVDAILREAAGAERDIDALAAFTERQIAGVFADHRRDDGLVNLADVEPEQVRWLWPNRIPLGKLTIIGGDPGLGKSFLTLDLAARLSSGTGWPDRPGEPIEPGSVVLLSAEDDMADTIVPRLMAAGADRTRVNALRTVRDLGQDLLTIERTIGGIGDVRLVVIDPISAYCGRADGNSNTEVRALLAPLSDMAARRGLAVVAVTHLNKSGNGPALYRIMGSLGFTAAARCVHGVTRDRDDRDRRLFIPIKSNVGPDSGGLAFRLHDSGAGWAIAWEADPVDLTSDEAMDPDNAGERSRVEEAVAFLRAILADGPLTPQEVEARAEEAGIKWRTIERAKPRARVKSRQERKDGQIIGWVWELVK